MFAYSVHCQFTGATPHETSDQWLDWLRSRHLADVLAAGALQADVIQWDDSPWTFEVRYLFESREAFLHYEKAHAPRLREEGKRLFPPDAWGLVYRRQTGEQVARQTRPQ